MLFSYSETHRALKWSPSFVRSEDGPKITALILYRYTGGASDLGCIDSYIFPIQVADTSDSCQIRAPARILWLSFHSRERPFIIIIITRTYTHRVNLCWCVLYCFSPYTHIIHYLLNTANVNVPSFLLHLEQGCKQPRAQRSTELPGEFYSCCCKSSRPYYVSFQYDCWGPLTYIFNIIIMTYVLVEYGKVIYITVTVAVYDYVCREDRRNAFWSE